MSRLFTSVACVLATCCVCGCMTSNSPSSSAYRGHAYLSESMIEKKFDREQVRAAAGNPTIDHGEEWVYVGKYERSVCVPLNVFVSIYDNTWDEWEMVVLTFDRTGHVTRIRRGFVESDYAENQRHWTLLNNHFDKNTPRHEFPPQASLHEPRPATQPVCP